jgi:hypothetical protein
VTAGVLPWATGDSVGTGWGAAGLASDAVYAFLTGFDELDTVEDSRLSSPQRSSQIGCPCYGGSSVRAEVRGDLGELAGAVLLLELGHAVTQDLGASPFRLVCRRRSRPVCSTVSVVTSVFPLPGAGTGIRVSSQGEISSAPASVTISFRPFRERSPSPASTPEPWATGESGSARNCQGRGLPSVVTRSRARRSRT